MIYSFSNSGFRDPETGVYNQTYFMEVFHREWYRHLREQQSLALLYLRPLISENLPHPHMLDFFSGRIQACLLRSSDLLARMNQQIFAVGLFNTDKAGTEAVISRINLQLHDFAKEYLQHHGIGMEYRLGASLCAPTKNRRPEEIFILTEEQVSALKAPSNSLLILGQETIDTQFKQ